MSYDGGEQYRAVAGEVIQAYIKFLQKMVRRMTQPVAPVAREASHTIESAEVVEAAREELMIDPLILALNVTLGMENWWREWRLSLPGARLHEKRTRSFQRA